MPRKKQRSTDPSSETVTRLAGVAVTDIQSQSDVPAFHRLLTHDEEIFALNEADHNLIALIQLNAKSRECALCFAERSIRAQRMSSKLIELAQKNNYSITRKYRMTGELLSTMYRTYQVVDDAAEQAGPGLGDSGTSRLLEDILNSANTIDASDIHIEVDKDGSSVRYRLYGQLISERRLSYEQAKRLITALYNTRLQDGSKLGDFKETLAQPGRLEIELPCPTGEGTAEYTYRYQSIPTHHGAFDVVLRRLTTSVQRVRTLEELGFDEHIIGILQECVEQPEGLLLMSGATGSGKTTTNAALLNMYIEYHGGQKKVRTIEDPVEIRIPGARQSEVAGETIRMENGNEISPFEQLLKSHLRGDPDCEMIGEIRDREAAKTIERMVNTGHVALSTIHANNPVGAITAMLALGADPHIVCSSDFFLAVLNQKLVQKICPHCAVDYKRATVTKRVKKQLDFLTDLDVKELRFKGPGCSECNQLGVIGVVPCTEIMVPNREILQLIADKRYDMARAYCRAGRCDHGLVTSGRTKVDVGIERMSRGELDPAHVISALGNFTRNESREDAARDLEILYKKSQREW